MTYAAYKPDRSPRPAVSRDEWLKAREALLAREKELTHLRDEVSAARRELPWVKIEKNYVFDSPDGKVTLADLFDGRSQLAVYHFMLTPGKDHICPGCSFIADHVDGARQHFEHADLSFAAISRAPLSQIVPVKKRMGWQFRWVRRTATTSTTTSAFRSSRTSSTAAPRATIIASSVVRSGSPTATAPASSPGTTRARCSTPTPPMLAATKSCWAPSVGSISHRRAATKTPSWAGCASTTNTKTRRRRPHPVAPERRRTNHSGRHTMSLTLYFHPLSSFCHKALIALYENGTPFEPHLVDLMDPAATAAFKAIWPIGKFPVLRDASNDRLVPESSIIIEYLDQHYPGATRFLPGDADFVRQTRFRDRFYDLHLQVPMQKIVTDTFRPPGQSDTFGVDDARQRLDVALGIVDRAMAANTWAMGDTFTMADCAAAPALFYADKLSPLAGRYKNAGLYLQRLKDRPSYARVLQEAEPYLAMFPIR